MTVADNGLWTTLAASLLSKHHRFRTLRLQFCEPALQLYELHGLPLGLDLRKAALISMRLTGADICGDLMTAIVVVVRRARSSRLEAPKLLAHRLRALEVALNHFLLQARLLCHLRRQLLCADTFARFVAAIQERAERSLDLCSRPPEPLATQLLVVQLRRVERTRDNLSQL